MGPEYKHPFVNTIAAAMRARVADAFHLLGKCLPVAITKAAGGNFFTVGFQVTDPVFTFPQLTVPLASSEFIRLPLQPNAPGIVVALDATNAQITGTSTGTADLTRPGNLESLVLLPVANKNFPAITGDDGNTLILYGPTASLLLDSKAAKASVKLNASGITATVEGGNTMTVTSSGVTVTLASGSTMSVTAGGTLSPVMTEAGPSPVLKADS
jgi:hypothetical protein